jgi:hypothetical protein
LETQSFPHPSIPAGPLLPSNDPFNDFFSGARSAVDDPSVAGDIVHALSKSVGHQEISQFTSELVQLPQPVTLQGHHIASACVRELTGADEEALARAAVSGQPERMLDVLLAAGVLSLGTITPTAADLLALPVADRDSLLLDIRIATYGPEMKFEQIRCQHCDADFELTYDLNEIDRHPSTDSVVAVALRRGGSVTLRFPNGSDQVEILTKIRTDNINRAEQDTLLIGRCLVNETATNGDQSAVVDGNARARAMSMGDRAAVLRALNDLRSGPRLDEATAVCPACSVRTGVPLSIDLLFRG